METKKNADERTTIEENDLNSSEKSWLKKVQKKIDQSSTDFYCDIRFDVPKKVQEYLEAQGFRIHDTSHHNGFFKVTRFRITW